MERNKYNNYDMGQSKCANNKLFILTVFLLGTLGCDKEIDETEKIKFQDTSSKISGEWMWLIGSAVTDNNEIISYYSGEANDCNRVENLFFFQYIKITPNIVKLEFDVLKEDLCGAGTIESIWKLKNADNGDGKISLTEKTADKPDNSIDLIFQINDNLTTLVVEQTGEFENTSPKTKKLGIYFYKL